MNLIFKLNNQTATCFTSCNEYHVSLKDSHGITSLHFVYKEGEELQAKEKYDTLVLAMRIEHTLKQKQQWQK